MEEEKVLGENRDPVDVLVSCLGSKFPRRDELYEELKIVLNNCYTVEEARELGGFCNRLWTADKWTDQDVEDFQIKLGFDEGLKPLYEQLKMHQAYEYIFVRERKTAGGLTTSQNDNNADIFVRPSTGFMQTVPSLRNIVPVQDLQGYNFHQEDCVGNLSSKITIDTFVEADHRELASSIHEIYSIKVFTYYQDVPSFHKMEISLYWYATRYTLTVKGPKVKFTNGMFPLWFFPKNFTLEIKLFNADGEIDSGCVENHGNYNLRIKGYKHNLNNLQTLSKKHSTRLTDPSDFGFLPDL